MFCSVDLHEDAEAQFGYAQETLGPRRVVLDGMPAMLYCIDSGLIMRLNGALGLEYFNRELLVYWLLDMVNRTWNELLLVYDSVRISFESGLSMRWIVQNVMVTTLAQHYQSTQ
jgi:hypothetical protein